MARSRRVLIMRERTRVRLKPGGEGGGGVSACVVWAVGLGGVKW